jgi:hypothetical protein
MKRPTRSRAASSLRETKAAIKPPAAPQPFIPPYRPSWFDRLKGLIERLPIPWWLFYLIVGAVSILVFTSVQARAGAYDDGFSAWHLFLAIQPVFLLAAVHYLSREPSRALAEFQPAMAEPERLPEVRYRLTVLPARMALIVTLIWILVLVLYYLQGPAGAVTLRVAPSTFPFWSVFTLLFTLSYGPFTAFAIHQVLELRRLFAQPLVIDLYHPEPMYAFSPLAARLAFVLALVTYGWGMSDPTTFTNLLSLATSIGMVALALAVFAFPLWGAHRKLAAEKKRALAGNGARLKSTAAELHRRLDQAEITGMDDLHKALASLDLERAHLSRVPTWPWQPETLRGLVAALALPIVIWLIQYGLGRLLG